MFVQFIGVAPGCAGGSPNKKFCRGNVNAAKSNFITPYKSVTIRHLPAALSVSHFSSKKKCEKVTSPVLLDQMVVVEILEEAGLVVDCEEKCDVKVAFSASPTSQKSTK